MKLFKSSIPVSKEGMLIILLSLIKILIHLLTYSRFELHRDAYLYYAQSEHLSWGYVAVPPSIAFIAKIATFLFGNTTFALRFFPALIGGINVIIIAMAVRELGGKKIAILLAGMAYILSPAYLHTNTLFQPVSFNHFYWILSGYLILKMIHRNNPKIWIWIAITFGLAFLNKYSIVFFYAAFAIALTISQHRKLYISKYFIIGVFVGLMIILPNLLWQYRHNWPVLVHLAELRETQLVHVRLSDFIKEQFYMNTPGLLLWVAALVVLLFYKKEAGYRVFGYIYLLVIILLMLGSGKPYYTLGIYPVLFVFGAYLTEKYITKYTVYIRAFILIWILAFFYISLSFDGIPFTTFEKAVKKKAFRWEDGVYHDIPQDLSDMTGWKEIGQKVGNLYQSMGDNRDNCDIHCYHYGQAGSIMFFNKNTDIPDPISFNGSFVFWAPDSLTKDYMIWIHSYLGNNFDPDSLLSEIFDEVTLEATINNKYFRENGTRIYLCKYPAEGFKNYYKSHIRELKSGYNRK